MLGYEEKALCRKIADTFKIAGKKGVFPAEFIEKWLNSETAAGIYNRIFELIIQSPLYIFNSLESESHVFTKDAENKKYIDMLYWMGYMITYIQFCYKILPDEVWEKYDLLRFASCYDTLHTLSAKRAAEELHEEFMR